MNNAEQPGQKCVLYARVSTAKQAKFGHSLNAQRDHLLNWAKVNNREPIISDDGCPIFFDKGKSAKTRKSRPALEAALELAIKNKVPFICCSLSRVARSVRDMLEIAELLSDQGSDLISLKESIDTTTPYGRLIFTIMAAILQLERELTADRTSEIHKYLRAHNKNYSRIPPYGLKRNPSKPKELIANKNEIRVLKEIMYMDKQKKGCRIIAKTLNEKCIPCRKGNKWSHTTIWRIVQRIHEERAEGIAII